MIDLLAALLVTLGQWPLGRKDRRGFLVISLGCALWILHGWQTQTWGLLIECPVSIAISIRNYKLWGCQENSTSAAKTTK